MSFRAKCRRCLGVTLLLAPRGALADGPQVIIDCPAWSRESLAQVETRVLATLITETEPTRVSISCRADARRVQLTTPGGQREAPIVAMGGSSEDDVLAALEQALRNPATPNAKASPVVVTGETAAIPQSAPRSADARQNPLRAAPMVAPQRLVDVHARFLLESWSGVFAEGLEAGLSVGQPQFSYGLAVAGRVAVNEPAGFELSEWSAASHVRFQVPRAAGLVGNVALGASLLAVAPDANLSSHTSMLVGAAFAELSISRPFQLGPLWLAPALGARLFGGRRHVNVNHHELATLSWAVPLASLSLFYRAN